MRFAYQYAEMTAFDPKCCGAKRKFSRWVWLSSRATRRLVSEVIDDQAETLPGEVVDQSQDTEAPATDQRVHHEVERPAKVGILGIVIGARVPRARLRPPRLRTDSRSSL